MQVHGERDRLQIRTSGGMITIMELIRRMAGNELTEMMTGLPNAIVLIRLGGYIRILQHQTDIPSTRTAHGLKTVL